MSGQNGEGFSLVLKSTRIIPGIAFSLLKHTVFHISKQVPWYLRMFLISFIECFEGLRHNTDFKCLDKSRQL